MSEQSESNGGGSGSGSGVLSGPIWQPLGACQDFPSLSITLIPLKSSTILFGGVRSKKFELISPKICRAGGIPPRPPFRPPAEATLSDWTILSFSLAIRLIKGKFAFFLFNKFFQSFDFVLSFRMTVATSSKSVSKRRVYKNRFRVKG